MRQGPWRVLNEKLKRAEKTRNLRLGAVRYWPANCFPTPNAALCACAGNPRKSFPSWQTRRRDRQQRFAEGLRGGPETVSSVTAMVSGDRQLRICAVLRHGRTPAIPLSRCHSQPRRRKLVITPDGETHCPRPRVDSALVKALARAHEWQRITSLHYAGDGVADIRKGRFVPHTGRTQRGVKSDLCSTARRKPPARPTTRGAFEKSMFFNDLTWLARVQAIGSALAHPLSPPKSKRRVGANPPLTTTSPDHGGLPPSLPSQRPICPHLGRSVFQATSSPRTRRIDRARRFA